MTDADAERVRAALEKVRQKPPTVQLYPGGKHLPAPIGLDCPEHPSYPLVLVDGQAWCRRGQHFVAADRDASPAAP